MKIPPRSQGMLSLRAERSFATRRLLLPVQEFIYTQGNSSIVLLAAALVALVWANTPWKSYYSGLWHTTVTVDLSVIVISQDLEHWVNDAFMTIFFFVVGLEIKRELVHGELSTVRKAALPVVAAVGGMVVPALLYVVLNAGGEGFHGWGIPMATDIAFALGALALLGNRIPAELKVLLLALAVVDDIGAILVIAAFYSEGTSFQALGIAVGLVALTFVMNRAGVRNVYAYVVVGALLWLAVFRSGVHATIAGVVLGLITPAQPYFSISSFAQSAQALLGRFRAAMGRHDEDEVEAVLGEFEELAQGTEAPLERLERIVSPWASYLVLPLFALANAGVELSPGAVTDALSSRITLGIVLGLVLGKLVGIVGFSWIAVRLGVGSLPGRVGWKHMIGVGLTAGIGFTVSLFITGLAFEDSRAVAEAKTGILGASVLAGLLGYIWLRVVTITRESPSKD